MIRFPVSDLLNPQECYDYLLRVLHPNGLKCRAGHPLPSEQAPHDRQRAPLVDYRWFIGNCRGERLFAPRCRARQRLRHDRRGL
jgi:hypothetical protein